MLDYNKAREILNYYGFKSKSIEPILIEKDKNIGVFSTFKTKYGHLSRYITFDTKDELEIFLKKYIKYQNAIDDENTYVEFDDYEKLSPSIDFYIGQNIELSSEVEELAIETMDDESMNLVDVVLERIKKELDEIDTMQTSLQKLIKEYLDKLLEVNTKIGRSTDQVSTNINLTDTNEYREKVLAIRQKILVADNSKFTDAFEEVLDLYEQILLDSTYLDNLYLNECYKEELRRTKKILELYNSYNAKKNKLFKRNKNQTFEDFLLENPIAENIIDQSELFENKNSDAKEKLSEFKNTSIEELKKKYNTKEKLDLDEIQEIDDNLNFDFKELSRYYKTLDDESKIKNLLISSPINELINTVNEIEIDKENRILNEKHFKKQFKEVYDIISNEDNYPIVKKCFKKINLDSLEEFVEWLVKNSENLKMNTMMLPTGTQIRFKMGVLMKKGYVNTSLKNEFPVNNKGVNTYYIVTTKTKLPVYYSNKLLVLNTDNTMNLIKNEEVVTFKIDGYKLTNKQEVNVKNYAYKRNEFALFNEKKYIICNMENGDN